MKSKKWLIIGIISVIFILLESAAAIFYVIPGIYKNKMLEELKNGNGAAAAGYYDKVRFLGEKDRDAEVKGFVISKTNDYLRDNGNYEETFRVVSATESIGHFKGKNLEALEDIALTQCIKLLDDSHKSFYDSDFSILDAAAEFSNVYNSVDKNGNSVLDGYVESDKSAYHKYMDERLDGYLKGKFTQYKSGEIDYDEINAYVTTAQNCFSNIELTSELSEELYFIRVYESDLSDIRKAIDEGNYSAAYYSSKNMYDNQEEQKVFADYKSEYKKIMDEAYQKAKDDGLAKALASAKAGDEETANQIMDELRLMCGSDVNFSEIEKYLTPKWAKAYAAFMENWDKNLETQCTTSPYVSTFTEKNKNASINSTQYLTYDKYKPDKMFLADIDRNGIPELVLISSLTCYIETYSDNAVKLVTLVVPIAGFGEKGIVIQKGEGSYGTIKISGDSAVFTHFIYSDDDTLFYRNGYGTDNMIDRETYMAEFEVIKGMDVYPLPGTYDIADYQKAIDEFRSN